MVYAPYDPLDVATHALYCPTIDPLSAIVYPESLVVSDSVLAEFMPPRRTIPLPPPSRFGMATDISSGQTMGGCRNRDRTDKDCILEITRSSSKAQWAKLMQVQQVMDHALGSDPISWSHSCHSPHKVSAMAVAGSETVLYPPRIKVNDGNPWAASFSEDAHAVTPDPRRFFLYRQGQTQRIVGCVSVEPIEVGYPLLPGVANVVANVNDGVSASVGISQVWVHPSMTRQGVATRLLDTLRRWFYYNVVVPKTAIAFSQPTRQGQAFADAYVSPSPLLVYTSLRKRSETCGSKIT